jgi:hypothetical protein
MREFTTADKKQAKAKAKLSLWRQKEKMLSRVQIQ